MSEARRQQALLAALRSGDVDVLPLGLREKGGHAARGLEAYRANAEWIAERALATSFGTVRALVGEESFARLAAEFWLAQLPVRGDLGEWGDAFAGWLDVHPALAMWPYIGDSARLDWAMHCNERAADAAFDAASLSLLGSTDPALLRLRLMPGTTLLRSAWPIAAIHAAHQVEGDEAERAFEAVRVAIVAKLGDEVMVVRKGWRAVLHPVEAATAAWLQAVLEGESIATALERAGSGFDFSGWLVLALRESWVQGVTLAAPTE
jgi:hypothetical protein